MSKVDCCIICGGYVPEGRMVCVDCEEASEEVSRYERPRKREKDLEYKEHTHKAKRNRQRMTVEY